MVVNKSPALQAETGPLYADVIVPRHLSGAFTYRVPARLKSILRVGHLVLVPFGRSMLQGAVIALSGTGPTSLAPERLKEIRSLATDGQETEILPQLLQLARRVSEAYIAPWGQCLRLVMPPIRFGQGGAIRLTLTQRGCDALETGQTIASPDAVDLLRRLKRKPSGIKKATLQKGTRSGDEALLSSLVRKGWIQENEEPMVQPPRLQETSAVRAGQGQNGAANCLVSGEMDCPKIWTEKMFQAIERSVATRLLIQAPRQQRLALLCAAIARTIGTGRTILVIVGEVERAEAIAASIIDKSTAETVCLHSGLPEHRKAELWEKIRQKHVQVVVGTRSAVFLPIQSIGLIWIEGEEDSALKEPQEPRYHVREVAWMRAWDENAILVLGSSHLSLEALGSAEHQEHLQQESTSLGPKPAIEIVDLRTQDRGTILSPLLVGAMQDTLRQRARSLLFLNRKGYAGALICRDCGQALRCPSCHVAFAYYRQASSLKCSYCGTRTSLPDLCPTCTGPRLQVIGEGTERVEEEVKRIFPQATVLRVDGETMRTPKSTEAIWRRIHEDPWDVLVGTQLVVRGDRIAPLGLVGVVLADSGLSLPDFRAAERTFHLLSDAVALALPSSCGGKVIIQSYLPSHHAIQAVAQQDDSIFRSTELSHRTALGYPPAVQLFVLHVSGKDVKVVEEAARSWVERLSSPVSNAGVSGQTAGLPTSLAQSNGLTVLGPVPSPIPKLRGRFRWQILVKSPTSVSAIQVLRSTVQELEKTFPSRMVKFDVDVNPFEMW